MMTNRGIQLVTIVMVIAFCLIQTRYQNEPSSSIIVVVCYLLKGMEWGHMLSDFGVVIFVIAAIGIFGLNLSMLTVAIMNRKGWLLRISVMHVLFFIFLWRFYGSFIILASAIPYFVLVASLIGLLIITKIRERMNKKGVS